MNEPNNPQPDSDRVEPASEGDAVLVFPPCCDTRSFIPIKQAVPGARLPAVCPRDGLAWLVELVADDRAESGLRAVWTEPRPGSKPGPEDGL